MSDEQNEGGNDRQDNGNDAILQGLENLLNRNDGDAGGVARLLYGENQKLRERIRTVTGQLPPEGATILTGDDLAAWQAYRALGAPDDLTTALTERDQAQGALATLQRESVLREAAEAVGFKHFVLTTLDRESLAYEMREEEADGKTVTVPFVKDGDAEPVKLEEYAAKHWSDFMPALRPESSGGRQNGTPYPPQGSGKAPPPQNPTKAYLDRTYKQRNS